MAAPLNAKLKKAGTAQELVQNALLPVETAYKQGLRNVMNLKILCVSKTVPSTNT